LSYVNHWEILVIYSLHFALYSYLEQIFVCEVTRMDLNFELMPNPASTFFVRVKGFSMHDAGVDDGDLLVIDKSLEYKDGAMAVCFIDGAFTLKNIKLGQDGLYLVPSNSPIKVNEDDDFTIWGIVAHIVKKIWF
jgi:DNA polymerase V